MIFIIGGMSQGKRDFAVRTFLASNYLESGSEMGDAAAKEGENRVAVDFADGEIVSWEVFQKAMYAYDLHQMIRRKLEMGEDPKWLEDKMWKQLVEGCPERILITDEIGCGIVPLDPFERQYRELTGRICCKLAAAAAEVWRVTAGIGICLKKGERMSEATVYGTNTKPIEEGFLQEIASQTRQAVNELLDAAKLKEGQLLAVGCSSSEIASYRIGSCSSEEIGQAVYGVISQVCKERGIYLAAQCCEHLNRALILEEEAADRYGYEVVNVVPQLKAGGSFATAAYKGMKSPVAVERVTAHAGLDIGDTLIGMHLRAVAVPVRLAIKQIGGAHVSSARVRPKFIGGSRACYGESE